MPFLPKRQDFKYILLTGWQYWCHEDWTAVGLVIPGKSGDDHFRIPEHVDSSGVQLKEMEVQ
jgi:hypothetical protein